jgi:hypothetical protein
MNSPEPIFCQKLDVYFRRDDDARKLTYSDVSIVPNGDNLNVDSPCCSSSIPFKYIDRIELDDNMVIPILIQDDLLSHWELKKQ